MKRFLLFWMMLPFVVACGDDDDAAEPSVGDDYVTVTGSASEVGFSTATVEGLVSIEKLTANPTSMSVEVQYTDKPGEWKSKEASVEPGGKVLLKLTNLTPETAYNYRTHVRMNGVSYVGETRSFSTKPLSNIVQECKLLNNNDGFLQFQMNIVNSPDADYFFTTNNSSGNIDLDKDIRVGVELSSGESVDYYYAHYNPESDNYQVEIGGLKKNAYRYRPFTCYKDFYAYGDYCDISVSLYGSVTITKAKMAEYAGTYKVSNDTPIKSEKSKKIVESISVMDGGQVSVTLLDKDAGDRTVVVADVDKTDVPNVGTRFVARSGQKIQGEFTVMNAVATSRADDDVQITLNITVGGETYATATGTPAQCAVAAVLQSMGGVLDYVCQKFQVKSMIIECEGDVKAYRTINSGNLMYVYNVAIDNGAGLTAEDKQGFNKTVKYVSLNRCGEINIIYADETCDGGNWNWLNNQADKLHLWLKDKDMGNKFIPENTTVDLEFRENTCSMTIHANIYGSKNYRVALTFVMEALK